MASIEARTALSTPGAGTILMIDECTAGGGSKALGGTMTMEEIFHNAEETNKLVALIVRVLTGTVIIVGLFGARFNEKSYFQSQPGAENAPQVKF